MDTCPGCSADPCTCNAGGDLSPDSPGAAAGATPDGGGSEGGDLGI